ncbi:hypothetical protein K440DRAFT_638108 [Wilcoxina mikolae CBS 423.85]|nr:hypothetical protein K440DRAFT_638108 [Wilcoxina mikolae CBS 423.85]
MSQITPSPPYAEDYGTKIVSTKGDVSTPNNVNLYIDTESTSDYIYISSTSTSTALSRGPSFAPSSTQTPHGPVSNPNHIDLTDSPSWWSSTTFRQPSFESAQSQTDDNPRPISNTLQIKLQLEQYNKRASERLCRADYELSYPADRDLRLLEIDCVASAIKSSRRVQKSKVEHLRKKMAMQDKEKEKKEKKKKIRRVRDEILTEAERDIRVRERYRKAGLEG